uniref:Conotoxin n=1 Tax=Conus betulinus TaxID=89764 RepID=A0A142C1F3_CONBE|nr:conotoxin [Conus betulinus]
MKLCVAFLLVLVILPSVIGGKPSERTLSGATRRGDRRMCLSLGQRCERHFNCCGDLCCFDDMCVVTAIGCGH